MDLSKLGLAVSVLTGNIFIGKKKKNIGLNGFCEFCSVPLKVDFTEEVIKAMIIYLDQQPNKTLRRVKDDGNGFEIILKKIRGVRGGETVNPFYILSRIRVAIGLRSFFKLVVY